MDAITVTVLLIIVFALAFNMSNGWNDAANAIATVISTRVLSPGAAIVFGSVLNFAGALVSGKVAETVGAGIAQPEVMTGAVLLAAVVTAPIWVTWCTFKGLPMSCSHSLLGALIGAAIASAGGTAGLKAKGILEIVYGVIVSPILGFVLGYLIVRFVGWAFARARPAVASAVFGRLQLVSAGAMAFAHGTGDAQKAMGVISAALLYAGWTHKVGGALPIPLWVKLLCAVTMAMGTVIGGRAVIKTLGSRLAHLKTYQGFSAETAAATTILVNTLGGVPISTTHSITGAVLGVGAARGVKTVRWGIGRKIVFAWIVTFPICILGGAAIFALLRLIGIR